MSVNQNARFLILRVDLDDTVYAFHQVLTLS
jgi:hypothetical protein